MPSRFKQSLSLIRDLRNEAMYRFKNESNFINKYLEKTSFSIDEQLMLNQEQFSERYPFLPNPLIGGFYNNFYATFVFIYEIENVLDEIEYYGVNLTRAETLMNLCDFLRINSSNVLMDLDDDFSFRKKYSLVSDVLVMAKNMYDYMLFAHNMASHELDFDDSVSITKYDETGSRLSCKYIRNGIPLLKLFHVLVLLRISPFYSDDIHDIADKLIAFFTFNRYHLGSLSQQKGAVASEKNTCGSPEFIVFKRKQKADRAKRRKLWKNEKSETEGS